LRYDEEIQRAVNRDGALTEEYLDKQSHAIEQDQLLYLLIRRRPGVIYCVS